MSIDDRSHEVEVERIDILELVDDNVIVPCCTGEWLIGVLGLLALVEEGRVLLVLKRERRALDEVVGGIKPELVEAVEDAL